MRCQLLNACPASGANMASVFHQLSFVPIEENTPPSLRTQYGVQKVRSIKGCCDPSYLDPNFDINPPLKAMRRLNGTTTLVSNKHVYMQVTKTQANLHIIWNLTVENWDVTVLVKITNEAKDYCCLQGSWNYPFLTGSRVYTRRELRDFQLTCESSTIVLRH